MCDEVDLAGMKGRGISRRQFAGLGAVALAACGTSATRGQVVASDLAEEKARIDTGAGTMDVLFIHPASGTHPAVILWPDIAGQREVFRQMAQRLAAEGYAVLVANPFYRSAPAPQFADFNDFREKNGFQAVGPWREQLTPEAVMQDARALISWLDTQNAVDTGKGIATMGFCMGGPFTVWTAAAVPQRVKAAASFHGAGLVGEEATAPVNLLDDTPQTHYLFAIGQNDDARAPEEKNQLREAAQAANVDAEIEVYPADHGWMVADSPVYAQEAAERAWTRMLDLYRKAL